MMDIGSELMGDVHELLQISQGVFPDILEYLSFRGIDVLFIILVGDGSPVFDEVGSAPSGIGHLRMQIGRIVGVPWKRCDVGRGGKRFGRILPFPYAPKREFQQRTELRKPAFLVRPSVEFAVEGRRFVQGEDKNGASEDEAPQSVNRLDAT